jgi:cell division transport system permease protein
MSPVSFRKKERGIGKAQGKRVYDLPLSRSAGVIFLLTLITLMSFLAVLALSSSFVLSAMTDRWSSGLENKLTIEIPAENLSGKLLTTTEIAREKQRIKTFLDNHPAVSSSRILTNKEIEDLVEPWLGQSGLIGDIPLPGLISVELNNSSLNTLSILETKIEEIVPFARVDTHKAWLNDLLRFTSALRFAAALLTIVIGVTTIIAIAGAVRSRMSENQEEVELLHLMGATDHYIAKQFQRHSMILGLQGSLAGLFTGLIAIYIIGWLSGEMEANLLPEFRLELLHFIYLFSIPVISAAIALITARFTVLKVLSELP